MDRFNQVKKLLTRRAFLTTGMALAAAAGVEFVGGKAPAFAQTSPTAPSAPPN